MSQKSKLSYIAVLVACALLLAPAAFATAGLADQNLEQGISAYSKDQLYTALACFHSAIAADPKNAVSHYYCANTLVRLGDDSNAAQEYAEAYRLSPSGTIASYCRQALSKLGQRNTPLVGNVAAAAPPASSQPNSDSLAAQHAAITIAHEATAQSSALQTEAQQQAADRVQNGQIISQKIEQAAAERIQAMRASGFYWNRYYHYWGRYQQGYGIPGFVYYAPQDGWGGYSVPGYSGGYNAGRYFDGGIGYKIHGMQGKFLAQPDGRNPQLYRPDPLEDGQAVWTQQLSPTQYVAQAAHLQAGIVQAETQAQAQQITDAANQRSRIVQQDASNLIEQMGQPASYGGIKLAPQGTNLYVRNYETDVDTPPPSPPVITPLMAVAKRYPINPPPSVIGKAKKPQ